MLIYSRPQLLLFTPGAEEEGAKDHTRDLHDAGCNELRQLTMISHSEDPHNITQEAMIIYNALVAKDVFQLHGPRVNLHRPAYATEHALAHPGHEMAEEDVAMNFGDWEVDWELQGDEDWRNQP